MVCGSADNVLVDAQTGVALEERDILYLPDYIVNAGGIINCAPEVDTSHYSADAVNAKVDEIYQMVLDIIALIKEKELSTSDVADMHAFHIIQSAKG